MINVQGDEYATALMCHCTWVKIPHCTNEYVQTFCVNLNIFKICGVDIFSKLLPRV
jgi:hypothetical protein